jgi:predicted enzyme related to lactoylglutathione lyase
MHFTFINAKDMMWFPAQATDQALEVFSNPAAMSPITGGTAMNRIVHLALKVNELEKAGAFYQQVFGFVDAETKKTRDHTSRHMSDGEIDFALLKYDAGTQSAESRAAGDGPCIHHFAVEVDDIAKSTEQILAHGCRIVSDPGVIPVKFHAPGGTVAELVPIGRYKKVAHAQPIQRIVHISLKVDDVQSTGDFYKEVFGFVDSETKKTRDHVSRHMSDGEIDFTLMKYDAGTQSAESRAAGAGPCIHHFAVEVEDIAKSTEQILAHGCRIVSDPGVIPVKFHAPGGTVAELVPLGRYRRKTAAA